MRDVKKTGGKKRGIGDFLQSINHLFLDTAPLIYYVEKHPQYLKILRPVFQRIDKGLIRAVTSPLHSLNALSILIDGASLICRKTSPTSSSTEETLLL